MEFLPKIRPKWPWRGKRVQVPKPDRKFHSVKFAVTSPFFFHILIHFKCKLLPNGEGVDSNANSVNATNDARHALEVGAPLTRSQAEFWYLVECQGCKELARSLRTVHDLALYHSDVALDTEEKSALFDLKVLWEGLEQMGAKA